jgi:hypothetical protein
LEVAFPEGDPVTALERLRQVAELLPAGASLTLSREALLEALGDVDVGASATVSAEQTVGELGVQFHRSPSTIRGWLEVGRFPGAYKLRGRDWRVPVAAVEAFVAAEQKSRGRTADLGSWRKHRRPA